jgi:hypothetical protein
MSREEDSPPTAVPASNPGGIGLTALPPPPNAPSTEPSPPPSSMVELLRGMEERITDRLIKSHEGLRQDFDRRLELQNKRFKENLEVAVELVRGDVQGVADQVKDLAGRVDAGFDRLDQKLRDEFNQKLGLESTGLKHVIASMPEFKAVKDTAEKAYNLGVELQRKHDQFAESERPTLTEGVRRPDR